MSDAMWLTPEPGIEARHPEVFRTSGPKRAAATGAVAAAAALFAFGLWHFDFSLARLFTGLRQLVWFLALMIPPTPGGQFRVYLDALGETLAIAFLGTTIAAVPAIVVGFLAARNVLPVLVVRVLLRRSLDMIRGVDTLIWALVWINVVGLGPFAGVLAIACSDFGALGKLFSEAIEAVDAKAREGVRAAGGGPIAEIRYALLPQVLPVIAGQVLYFIESNTRSATIIGIVGAGGIGLHLAEQIRTLEWQHVSFIVLMVLATVAIIDAISTRLRAMMTGRVTARD